MAVLDLSPIYTTTGEVPFEAGAELRCEAHPDWWADVDGTNFPDVIKKAEDHVEDAHRGPVEGV